MRAMRMGFKDRGEAGRQLARLLGRLASERPLVVAVARGGIPVGYEVAHALGAPLEAVVVTRMVWQGTNGRKQAAALGEDGVLVPDRLTQVGGSTDSDAAQRMAMARSVAELEIARRVERYRGGRPLPSLAGRSVILVDDGLGSGTTQRAAIEVVRAHGPARLVLAVPVGSLDEVRALRRVVDEVVCVEVRMERWATGLSYSEFPAIDDDEVVTLLHQVAEEPLAHHA